MRVEMGDGCCEEQSIRAWTLDLLSLDSIMSSIRSVCDTLQASYLLESKK